MLSPSTIREISLSFPEATEEPHFDKTSFRVKKKIFATMNVPENRFVVKLTALQQSVYCVWDTTACYPVPNKFGLQGWTIVHMDKVDEEYAQDILKTAYINVAPAKLSVLLNQP